jgi:hypothetical protein
MVHGKFLCFMSAHGHDIDIDLYSPFPVYLPIKGKSLMPFLRICMEDTSFVCLFVCLFRGSAAQRGLWPPRTTRFPDHTQRRATISRTSLDE